MSVKKHRILSAVKFIVVFLSALILSVAISFFFTAHLWDFKNARANLAAMSMWKALNRAYIIFFPVAFLGLHFVIPVRKLYGWLFEKRWLVGIGLLLLLTASGYHGDSSAAYNFIQPGSANARSNPIFGETRSIRSDEFLVGTPSVLASSYGDKPYGKYNRIMRGTDTLNILNGVYLGFATLGNNPQKLVYAILPVEYAFSFCWWFPMIFGFLANMELFLIISNKKRLLSAAGACLVIFSSFYMWWTFSMHLLAAPGAVVCICYFLRHKEKWKKALFAGGAAVCLSIFVTNLYPAWQVPLGYMFLAVGIWLLHDNWDKVRQLRAGDWVVAGAAFIFFASMVLTYLGSVSEYTNVISKTVYPGARSDTGGFFLQKLFYYAQAPFYAYKDIGNPSEAGVFFSLFPVPTIMAVYLWIRSKKKDWLTAGLLIAEIPMLIFITFGLPEGVAKLLLLSHSTGDRACDIVGLLQIYLLVAVMSRYEKEKRMPTGAAIPISLLTAGAAIWFSNQSFEGYMTPLLKAVMFIVIAALCMGVMVSLREFMKSSVLIAFMGISVFTAAYVRPVMKGFDAFFSKPVSARIQEICAKDPDALWLAVGGGYFESAYSVACGAPTVNSVNTYPNMKLWEELDPSSKYGDIYNRYAHVTVEFTEEDTSFELVALDNMKLRLSYKDIEKTKARYVFVMNGLKADTENPYVKFEKVYERENASIYRLAY